MGVSLSSDPHRISGTLPTTTAEAHPLADGSAGADWTAYGGTGYGDRYSSLAKITPANVSKLKLAWEFRTGDLKGPDDPVEITNEATPLENRRPALHLLRASDRVRARSGDGQTALGSSTRTSRVTRRSST